MHVLLQNCLRITVSTDEENAIFLTALKAARASEGLKVHRRQSITHYQR
jgi:histidinol-phosphate/aromatic aminotransferase/cobyric acid decarboxylase-like protein